MPEEIKEHKAIQPTDKPAKQKKILILSLDWDDCLIRKSQAKPGELDAISAEDFHKVVNEFDSSILRDKVAWKHFLKNNNQPLFSYISSIAYQYGEVIICCGSNR